MTRTLVLAVVLALSFHAATAQQPEPPKSGGSATQPPRPRRTFDQFDLPGFGSARTPIAAEPLDDYTFNGLMELIEHTAEIERHYSNEFVRDPTSFGYIEYYAGLRRKLAAIHRVIEMYRGGLLDAKIRQQRNLDLLKANQGVIRDIHQTLALMTRRRQLSVHG